VRPRPRPWPAGAVRAWG